MTLPAWAFIARWTIGGLAAAFGAYVIAFNWAAIPWNSRLHARGEQRHVSTVPLAGPLMLTFGLVVATGSVSIHLIWCWLMDWPTVVLPLVLFEAVRRR